MTMYRDFTPAKRKALYTIVKKFGDLPKVTFCLFERAHLKKSIGRLADYRLECEVTQSVYSRSYSAWTEKWKTRGKLSREH